MSIVHEKQVRVVVIGAGKMANSVHYPSLASLEDVQIAAICDLNPEAITTTADRYGISRRYTDYKQMIGDVQPDAAIVIGQPHIMYDIYVWCLRQKLNLYIEKPMSVNIHQARSLTYLAEQNDCITQVSFQRRNAPMYVLLRDECLKKGPIIHAVCAFNKVDTGPYLSARDKMLDDCVHAIDTLRWMCGGQVVRIDSATRRVQVPNINVITAMLHFDNGAIGMLCNNEISGRRIFAFEMHAPGICAEAELEGKGYLYDAASNSKGNGYGSAVGVEYDTMTVSGSTENYIFGGYRAKHREFIDCLKSGTQPSSCFADSLKTMEAAEIILARSLFEESRIIG